MSSVRGLVWAFSGADGTGCVVVVVAGRRVAVLGVDGTWRSGTYHSTGAADTEAVRRTRVFTGDGWTLTTPPTEFITSDDTATMIADATTTITAAAVGGAR